MMNKVYRFWILAIFLLGSLLIWRWLLSNPTAAFTMHVPGMDKSADAIAGKKIDITIGSNFEKFVTDETQSESGEWPRFRGKDFDNILKEKTSLIDTWPASGPITLWSVQLGEGHSAPVITHGKVLILDYDETKKADALRCFSLKTGKELWQRWYKVPMKRNHGLSRTTPAISGDYIVTIGPKCHVMCTRISNGDLVWGIDLVKDYETEVPLWYTGQCPLIDEGMVILAPGNKSLMLGVELETGKILWKSENPNKIRMSHSSIMPTIIHNKKMYVYCGLGGMTAVSAEKEDAGKQLWFTSDWNPSVIAPSPLFLPDNKVFVTAGYGAGGALFKVNKINETFEIQQLDKYPAKEGLASEQQTPILFQNHLIGIHPKDAGGQRNQLACYAIDDLHNPVWMSGKEDRFELGPYLIADNKIILLNDDGELFLIKADLKKYERLSKFKVLDGHDAWAPMALVDGLLLLRDSKTMICIDLNTK